MSSAKKILMVDDDAALRDALAEQFALHEEFDVTQAATALEGLEIAKSQPFDMILLDVALGEADGRERRPQRDIHGALQLVGERRPYRSNAFRIEDQDRHQEPAQRLGCPQAGDPVIDENRHFLG